MPHHIAAATTKELSVARAIVESLPARRLPPDPEDMNEKRAWCAQVAVSAFQRGMRGTGDGEALADLLCDLMHLCDRRDDEIGWNFEAAVRRARKHYAEETESIEEKSNG